MAYLQDHNVNVIPWPAVSPDLNPIENVRARTLGRKSDELFAALEDV